MVASFWAKQAKTVLLNLARWIKVRETGPGVAKIIWGVLGLRWAELSSRLFEWKCTFWNSHMQMILKAAGPGESWEEIREWKEEPCRLEDEWLVRRERKGVVRERRQGIPGKRAWECVYTSSDPALMLWNLLCACADSVFVAAVVVIVLFINLTSTKVTWDEGTSTEELCLHQIVLWECLWEIFLIEIYLEGLSTQWVVPCPGR